MNCIYHPNQAAITNCISCNNPICSDCRKEIEGRSYCHSCVAKIVQPPKVTEGKKWWSCWLKGCAIGCGVFILILFIITALIWANRERIKEGVGKIIGIAQVEALKKIEDEVMANLPEGSNEQELREVFDALEKMVHNKELSFMDFGGLVNEYNQALKDGKLEEYEVRRILNEARRIAGGNSKE